jgi:hypothetical protein
MELEEPAKRHAPATVAELFPELIDPALDDDGQPSCSALAALERQEPFVNPALANHALGLLAHLFRYASIEHHGAFVNLQSNRVQPLAIDPRCGNDSDAEDGG